MTSFIYLSKQTRHCVKIGPGIFTLPRSFPIDLYSLDLQGISGILWKRIEKIEGNWNNTTNFRVLPKSDWVLSTTTRSIDHHQALQVWVSISISWPMSYLLPEWKWSTLSAMITLNKWLRKFSPMKFVQVIVVKKFAYIIFFFQKWTYISNRVNQHATFCISCPLWSSTY